MLHATVVFWSVLMSLVNTRAPEDANAFCESDIFLSNTQVLLDSYNYINLLPPHEAAVWQQVDNDMNNEAGAGTEVSLILN